MEDVLIVRAALVARTASDGASDVTYPYLSNPVCKARPIPETPGSG